MSLLTEDVAARLRQRGYDAVYGRGTVSDTATDPSDFVIINAIVVIGWRYPHGDWHWDDRPAYFIDHGTDEPPERTPPPGSARTYRFDWLPSVPGSAVEHPCGTTSAAHLTRWIATRLPPPARPEVLLLHHPSDPACQPDHAGPRSIPRASTWPWTADWEAAWADHDRTLDP
jgi:hypothetical protein